MSIAPLLDGLRALPAGTRAPAVVLAGVSGSEAAAEVITGLAELAEARGVRLVGAELSVAREHRLLRARNGGGEPAGAAPLELGSSPKASAVRAWLEAVGAGRDLVVIEAPPLDTSLDAALLACDCEGLVVVVEAGVTSREVLSETVERAKATGCELLGLVMHGHRRWLPRWLSKLLGSYPRTVKAPAPRSAAEG